MVGNSGVHANLRIEVQPKFDVENVAIKFEPLLRAIGLIDIEPQGGRQWV